jgi:metal-responsive CopG/Arc/MetJ family transcriptional regulator
MKVKTSITLTDEILQAVDRMSKPKKTRSEFIETAVKRFIAEVEREEIDRRDLEIINKKVKKLNKEASDVLSYQVDL